MTDAVVRPRGRLWGRLGLALTVLVVVLGCTAVFGFAIAPVLIRNSVIRYFDKTAHRKARLDRVRVNPFTLSLEFDGFSAPDRDGKAAVAFSRLFFPHRFGDGAEGRALLG